MLTKTQQAYIDEVVARAGKPSAALQLQIDQLRAAKTEDELIKLFRKDSDVVRPKIEAELLCMVVAAKLVELNPSINAESLKKERQTVQTPNHKNPAVPDYREAKYWREAAEKGDAESQYHLGISYENGFGVAGDEAETIKWLRKAAEQGNADAQSYLGLKYLYGLGVLKNTDEGRKWLQKAADQGDEGAIEQLATKEMKPSATKGEPAKNTKTELQHGVKNAEDRMQKKGITMCQLFLIMGLILFFSGMGINAGGDTGTAIFLFILSVPCFIGFLKTIDKE